MAPRFGPSGSGTKDTRDINVYWFLWDTSVPDAARVLTARASEEEKVHGGRSVGRSVG